MSALKGHQRDYPWQKKSKEIVQIEASKHQLLHIQYLSAKRIKLPIDVFDVKFDTQVQ